MIQSTIELYSPELLAKIDAFKKDWYKSYKKISKEKTPEVDGSGRKIIDKRPDGYDFIIEAYMRDCLDRHFPGWSWEMGGTPQFLGAEWIVTWGTLSIIDEHLLALGINPPYRKFGATNGTRIKYKKGMPHEHGSVIDIGRDVSASNSKAFKKAVNQLTHIGDDVYGKRIEEEGAGSYEDIVTMSGTSQDTKAQAFNQLVKSKHLTWSKVFEMLGVKSLSEITDFGEAYEKIKGV